MVELAMTMIATLIVLTIAWYAFLFTIGFLSWIVTALFDR